MTKDSLIKTTLSKPTGIVKASTLIPGLSRMIKASKKYPKEYQITNDNFPLTFYPSVHTRAVYIKTTSYGENPELFIVTDNGTPEKIDLEKSKTLKAIVNTLIKTEARNGVKRLEKALVKEYKRLGMKEITLCK